MIQQLIDGRTDLVFDLLHQGHPATETDEYGQPIIAWCAYHGDVSAVKFLLDHGESLSTLGENLGLHGAAFHGNWQLCQFIIDQGADPTFALAETLETPLHAALCKAGRPVYRHVVEILLAHDADPNMRTADGAETSAFMRDVRTRAESPLHRAAAFASPEIIDILIQAGADRTLRDANGDTPLTWASWHLRPPDVLRLLCFDDYTVHSDNDATYDHGTGWSQLDPASRGRPHL